MAINPSFASKGSYATIHVPDAKSAASMGFDMRRPLVESMAVRIASLNDATGPSTAQAMEL